MLDCDGREVVAGDKVILVYAEKPENMKYVGKIVTVEFIDTSLFSGKKVAVTDIPNPDGFLYETYVCDSDQIRKVDNDSEKSTMSFHELMQNLKQSRIQEKVH